MEAILLVELLVAWWLLFLVKGFMPLLLGEKIPSIFFLLLKMGVLLADQGGVYGGYKIALSFII